MSSPKTEMATGIFVNESGRILVSLFFWIGKRVTTLLPIFFYHKLAQSLLTMGLGRVVTPPGLETENLIWQRLDRLGVKPGTSLYFCMSEGQKNATTSRV